MQLLSKDNKSCTLQLLQIKNIIYSAIGYLLYTSIIGSFQSN